MLKIKLFRFGKKGQPKYRIVVVEARSKRGGKYVDLLGTYNPLAKSLKIKLDNKKYQDWISKGAQPTERIRQLTEKKEK